MTNLSFETAFALLRNIHEYTSADFDSLGINQQDFELIAAPVPWQRANIPRVMRTLNALLFGSLEILGMNKITVPSEYVAAVVSAIVAPANRMVACIWLAQERQTGVGALQASARAQLSTQLDPTSSDQLFALVCLLSATEASSEARNNLARKLGIALVRAQQETFKQ